jgi:lysophospholipase
VAEAAPLISIPASPVPEGGTAEWFAGPDGARLRAALFVPDGPARGSVVVSPGRTEPIEKYFEVVDDLKARGFAVLVHDWRGQGLSQRALPDRLLGHASGYAPFLSDYRALADAFEARAPRPWIALGHSMGGCLSLLALAQGEARFAGAVLSAPMLGLMTGAIPRPVGRTLALLLRAVGRGGAPVQRARPGAAQETFETNILTHDRARWERNQALIEACPDLALGPPTWGWLDFAFSATAILDRGGGLARMTRPLTVVSAGEERLVDNLAQRRITARAPAGRFVEIPGAFHEILQETDPIRAAFWREFDAMADRVASS